MIKPYYRDEYATIYHGDCREILPQLEPVDLVLTDPPYNVTQNKWDKFDFIPQWWAHMRRLAKNAVVMTAQQPFTSEMVLSNRQWFRWADVWHKTQARGHLNAKVMPLREHEDILVFGPNRVTYNPQLRSKPSYNVRPNTPRTKGTANYGTHGLTSQRTVALDESYPRSVVRFENSQEGLHPTQKPLALFAYLLMTFTNHRDTILDPFTGSGTTLRAAKDLGIKAIGVEIEEKYCEIAAKRMAQEVLSFD
jgi:site-specific DNA-methyltransferase (adenine-specific)